jgi:hypothetical protein
MREVSDERGERDEEQEVNPVDLIHFIVVE